MILPKKLYQYEPQGKRMGKVWQYSSAAIGKGAQSEISLMEYDQTKSLNVQRLDIWRAGALWETKSSPFSTGEGVGQDKNFNNTKEKSLHKDIIQTQTCCSSSQLKDHTG